jgi:hypothetical protein
MSDVSPALPVVVVSAPAGRATSRGRGGPGKTARPSRERQAQRLDGRFDELARLVDGQSATAVAEGILGADPELVVVFEVVEASVDLQDAFEQAGLELMLDVEDAIDDEALGEDFARVRAPQGNAEPVKRYLHAAMANASAVAELVRLWNLWKSETRMGSGFGPFRPLFERLHNLRPWGPSDRVRSTGLESSLAVALEEGLTDLPVNIELFFRRSEERRRQTENEVAQLVADAGGQILRAAVHPEIGYHALAAELPTGSFGSSDFDTDSIALLRAPGVLFVRPAGQSTPVELPGDMPEATDEQGPGELREPLIALLDGLPESNHPLLRGRIIVLDPDDFGAEPTYISERRRHGTMVASVLVWGDRGSGPHAATREIVARPVMKPDLATRRAQESIPWDELPPDVTIRAVQDIVTETPSVRIVNLSLGDPLAQFDTVPSGWARAIDWLAYRYNLLFVVSAGNHVAPLPIEHAELARRTGTDRDQVLIDVLGELSPTRRLLSPAEALNAVTVGALHADESGDGHAMGYRVDVWNEPGHPSPITAHGRGIRRAVKPDVAAPGGRQLYAASGGTGLEIAPATAAPPGVQVAAPPTNTAWVSGTTFAAAEVSRRAAAIMDSLLERDDPVDEEHLVVATKALLAHGAVLPEGAYGVDTDRLVGHGRIERDLGAGCTSNQATVLFVGDLRALEEVELVVPLPAELAARTDVRRVTTTLAWLSPINWNHRQYRRAKLTVDGPSELRSGRSRRDVGYHQTRRGTLEHHAFETRSAYAATEMTFTVKCVDQAGGLADTVHYALAVSLEIGVSAGVDVYELVREQLAARVRV